MKSGLSFEEKFNKIYFRNPLKMEKALNKSIAQYESSNSDSPSVKARIVQLKSELEKLKKVPEYLYQFHKNETMSTISIDSHIIRAKKLAYKYKVLAQKQELELASNPIYDNAYLYDLFTGIDGISIDTIDKIMPEIVYNVNNVKDDNWRENLIKRRKVKNEIIKVLDKYEIDSMQFINNHTMLIGAVFQAIVNDKNI